MTEPSASTRSSVAGFYDTLAADYDAMTSFDKRFAIERPHIRFLVERYRIATAVDAGCGTGFLALLLAQLGVSVTAADISPAMIARVKAHAAALNLRVRTATAAFHELPAHLTMPVDALFCLGNSLPHLPDRAALLKALLAFRFSVRPGGLIVLQMLNYDRVLAERTEVLSTRTAGTKVFTRSYAYHESSIDFSIRTDDRERGTATEHTIALHPFRPAELASLLTEAGFVDTVLYGDLALQPFDAASSRDVVAVAAIPTP